MSEKHTQGGISAKTLLIAGAASAAAALLIPMLWRPGTVFAAAMTPIVVALVTEVLRRPVDTVSAVRGRRTTREPEFLDPSFDEPFDPLAPPSAEELAELPATTAPTGAVHRRRPLTARQWKLALSTGLVAFAAAAVFVTASDLVAGDAVSGGGRTTFFGGAQSESGEPATRGRSERPADDPAPKQEPAATQTPTATATPQATETPTPTTSPAPAEPTPAPVP